jgi:hypothetical protein
MALLVKKVGFKICVLPIMDGTVRTLEIGMRILGVGADLK